MYILLTTRGAVDPSLARMELVASLCPSTSQSRSVIIPLSHAMVCDTVARPAASTVSGPYPRKAMTGSRGSLCALSTRHSPTNPAPGVSMGTPVSFCGGPLAESGGECHSRGAGGGVTGARSWECGVYGDRSAELGVFERILLARSAAAWAALAACSASATACLYPATVRSMYQNSIPTMPMEVSTVERSTPARIGTAKGWKCFGRSSVRAVNALTAAEGAMLA
mmetsp:Transcript_4416/g.14281  ORF Transcript_4416/g.14281 Transcript_4416/m.14281 type:complete len:224 (+) Transcript_4416:187-858(+)